MLPNGGLNRGKNKAPVTAHSSPIQCQCSWRRPTRWGAAALENAARSPGGSPEAAAEAEHTATEIRAETSHPEPNVGKIKQLLFSAMTGIAAAFGQAAGTDLAHLASEALQTF